MKAPQIHLSLVVPCYNEETNLQKGVLDKIGNYTKSDNRFHEVIIVDDGSTDASRKIISLRYLPKFPKFRLIENEHQGKALAVITGIEEAKSPFVMFTDIDLATPLEESEKMIEAFEEGHVLVIGSRAMQRQGAPWSRQLQSKGFVFMRNMLIGLSGIQDTQCGFKGFRTDVARDIIKKMRVFTHQIHVQGASVSAAFDLEFLFIARKSGYPIYEIPVKWRHAETKNVSLVKDSIETIRYLLKMRIYELQGKYT